jgi:hypothetical protein
MLPTTSRLFAPHFVILIIVAVLLNGCKPVGQEAVGIVEGKNVSGKQIGLPCQLAAKTENSAGGKYPISFAIDGSVSMAGFVKNSNSRYGKVLEILDNISLVNPGSVEYLRFDESVKKLDRAGFQQSKTPAFYTGKTNKIADVLESSAPKTEKLVMIVTDLQQDDGDTKQATKKLVDNYLKIPGYAVAIWGFKSEFDGSIYPPNSTAPYPYQATTLANGHPFYILMVGKIEHLNDFTKQMRTQGSTVLSDNSQQFSLLSSDSLVEEVAYLKGDTKAMPSGFSAPSSLLFNGVALKDGGQPIGMIELGGRAEKSKLDYSLSSKVSGDQGSAWITQTTTTMKKLDDAQSSFVVDPSVKPADFQAKHTIKDQGIDVSIDLNPDGFKNGLYYATTDVQVVALKTPSSWDSWHGGGGQNNGAKTAGLKEFLDSLAVGVSTLTKAKPVTIARVCHGIQKN